jgi:hypothetical protein
MPITCTYFHDTGEPQHHLCRYTTSMSQTICNEVYIARIYCVDMWDPHGFFDSDLSLTPTTNTTLPFFCVALSTAHTDPSTFRLDAAIMLCVTGHRVALSDRAVQCGTQCSGVECARDCTGRNVRLQPFLFVISMSLAMCFFAHCNSFPCSKLACVNSRFASQALLYIRIVLW